MTGCGWQKVSEHYRAQTGYQRYGKRIADIVIASIALGVVLPLIGIFALWIHFDSPGPIFYRQQRIGYRGKVFILYKFRTMVEHASEQQTELASLNEANGPFFKIKNDPRITKSGHWLRTYSLDELPQLWNVLKGEMSLVGPRPILATELKQFEPWMCERFTVRPGITGLWQVTAHKNTLPFREWLERDIHYVTHVSVKLDSWIVSQTFRVVFQHDNE